MSYANNQNQNNLNEALVLHKKQDSDNSKSTGPRDSLAWKTFIQSELKTCTWYFLLSLYMISIGMSLINLSYETLNHIASRKIDESKVPSYNIKYTYFKFAKQDAT